jgi:ABC-type transporter Mla subunit MlaD
VEEASTALNPWVIAIFGAIVTIGIAIINRMNHISDKMHHATTEANHGSINEMKAVVNATQQQLIQVLEGIAGLRSQVAGMVEREAERKVESATYMRRLQDLEVAVARIETEVQQQRP